MKKIWLLIGCLIASITFLHGQEELKLISSDYSRIDGSSGQMINYLPVYQHKGSTLRADSGYVYTDDLNREFFDAFSQVVITQPNGTLIFADKLNYAAETRLAVLTGNVRMVDKNTVLTTNYLTYNLNSDLGTYRNGGRITNETDTITSDRAWYFNNTKDAYFRLDVIVRTPDVKIFTDTMRYNTESKTTYFYGPTNIKGKEGENLYTENGFYNTESEQAAFYENNLYTEASRMLRGDTLLYDGLTGNGRALNDVFFIDTADKFFIEGMMGIYNKEEESILMTDRALVTIVVNEQTDSLTTDSIGVDDPLFREQSQVDSVYWTADSLYSRMILLKDYVPMEFNLDRAGGALLEQSSDLGSPAMDGFLVPEDEENPTAPVEPDIPIKDTIITEILPDTTAFDIQAQLAADSVLRSTSTIPRGGEVDSLLMEANVAMSKPMTQSDSISTDSLANDTTKTRIVKAYQNVRLFKSDLQTVADSAYYSYADSMMRFFGSPMAWTQGSQLSGDSLFLQLKNDKIDNIIFLRNAFVVNTKHDSTKSKDGGLSAFLKRVNWSGYLSMGMLKVLPTEKTMIKPVSRTCFIA